MSNLPQIDAAYLTDFLVKLLNIPSPTGFTEDAIAFVEKGVLSQTAQVIKRMIIEIDSPSRLTQDRSQPFFIEGLFELLKLLDDRVLLRFEHQVQAAEDNKGQDHVSILMSLERAA
jgi:hypothetical protein